MVQDNTASSQVETAVGEEGESSPRQTVEGKIVDRVWRRYQKGGKKTIEGKEKIIVLRTLPWGVPRMNYLRIAEN